jgi:predicted O-linked N-acetylglucosamine transferase (SPINDLY family)
VRNDGIDILVDLSMHTADNRLLAFAHKPAPVQVSWLAYPGSSGLQTIDYRLTDAHLDPVKPADPPGEQIVRLPDAWCCYAPIEEFPPVSPLPSAHTGTVTFGSLNDFAKIHAGLLHCWATLLEAAPGSRLPMICPEGQSQERTHAIFAGRGIARERVELVAPCPWQDYIRLFQRIDLALDAYPYNGMTTTCHALWMGVPTVTLVGTRAVSRAGSSLLHTIGLSEWVAQSEEEYLRIAAEWATILPRLAELRATLRPRMQASPLMDAPRFARNIETAYRTTWQAWCARQTGQP